MKTFMALFLLTVATATVADDSRRKANEHYFDLTSDIEIVLDKARPQLDREEAFKNLADSLTYGAGAGLPVIKDGFLRVIISDPAFFSAQMAKYQGAYANWLEKLNLRWVEKGPTQYPELKSLAIKSLSQSISTTERQLAIQREVLKKLESMQPSVLQ